MGMVAAIAAIPYFCNMNKTIDRHNHLRLATRQAAAIVAAWPEWKRNLLVDSMRATNPRPREEVKPKPILKR